MAFTVRDIKAQANILIAAELVATAQPLKFIYEPSRNNSRDAKDGYGIRALSAFPSPAAITQAITLEHDFEFILTDTVPNNANDEDREDVNDKLFSETEDIMKSFINTRINLPAIVLKVSQPTIPLPEFDGPKKIVIFRTQFTVTYRVALL